MSPGSFKLWRHQFLTEKASSSVISEATEMCHTLLESPECLLSESVDRSQKFHRGAEL
jgi:hypothetical protein